MKKIAQILLISLFYIVSLHALPTFGELYAKLGAGVKAITDPLRYTNNLLSKSEKHFGFPDYSMRAASVLALAAGGYAASQNETCKKVGLHLLIDPLAVAGAIGTFYWYRSSQIKAWKKLAAEDNGHVSFISWHATDRYEHKWKSAQALREDKNAVVAQLINECSSLGVRSAGALKERIAKDKKALRATLDQLALYSRVPHYIIMNAQSVKADGRTRNDHEKIMDSCRNAGKHLQAIDKAAHDQLLDTALTGKKLTRVDSVISMPSWKVWQWRLMPRSQEMGAVYWDLVRLYARLWALEDVVQANNKAIRDGLKEKQDAWRIEVKRT